MRMLRALLAAVALLQSATAATAGPCDDAMSQGDMNACFCGEREKADAQLNEAYQKLLKELAPEPLAVEKLRAAQRAWLAFRDAHLASLYPAEGDPRLVYGSVHPMCECMAETELVRARVAQLRRMLDPAEGDVCN